MKLTRKDEEGLAWEEKPRPSRELFLSGFVGEGRRRKPREKLPHIWTPGKFEGVDEVGREVAHVVVQVAPRPEAGSVEVRPEILRHLLPGNNGTGGNEAKKTLSNEKENIWFRSDVTGEP